MSLKTVLAVAALSLGLTCVQAYAENESTCEPYAARPALQTVTPKFASETGAEAYLAQHDGLRMPSSMAELVPAFGSEAPVQTANALPPNFERGTPAFAQAKWMARKQGDGVRPADSRTASLAR